MLANPNDTVESLPTPVSAYPNPDQGITNNASETGNSTDSHPDTPSETPPNTPLTINRTPKYIPIQDIIKYIEKGLTYAEIGSLVGCSASNVCQRLERAGYTLQGSENYRKNRAEVLQHVESRIINTVSDGLNNIAVESTKDVLNLTLAASKLYGDERLERGLSTANVDIEGMSAEYQKLKQELEEYEKREGLTIDVTPTESTTPTAGPNTGITPGVSEAPETSESPASPDPGTGKPFEVSEAASTETRCASYNDRTCISKSVTRKRTRKTSKRRAKKRPPLKLKALKPKAPKLAVSVFPNLNALSETPALSTLTVPPETSSPGLL
jgi:hypothetical protein